MKYIARLVVFSFWFVVLCSSQAYALTIQNLKTPSGLTLWLVEDHSLPVIALKFAFKGGVEQDPEDKQGLATLATTLMQRGAGAWDDRSFQKQLTDHSISFDLNASRDAVYGSLYVLQEDQDLAARLVNAVLTAPRFDADVFERGKLERQAAIKQTISSPDWQARYGLFSQLYAGHPYGMRSLGSLASIAAMTRDDIVQYPKKALARDHLSIVVVGAMTPQQAMAWSDTIFAHLPEKAQLKDVKQTQPQLSGQTYFIARPEATQTTTLFVAPGISEQDPDWHAAQVLNYILGGGDFSSRLMKEVRDQRGLTYGISTSLNAMDYSQLLLGSAAMDTAKTPAALATIKQVWADLFTRDVSEDELTEAKDYLTGALPLAFSSTRATADVVLGIMREGLGIDYLDKRNDKIRAVTLEDVRRVAKRLLDPAKLTIVAVGVDDGLKPDVSLPWVGN